MKLFLLALIFSSCVPKDLNDVLVEPSIIEAYEVKNQVIDKVEILEEGGNKYLYRRGEDNKGNCILTRTLLVQTDGLVFMRRMGNTETCTGKNCSFCAFKTTGGCECKNSLNTCEHTITKNTNVFKLN